MNKKERVIFLVDIEGSAKKGEIREVGRSFAENFLLPKGKALLYNKNIETQLQQQKEKLDKEQTSRKNREERIFTSIEEEKLTFFLQERKGKIFGSITAFDIIKSLKEKLNIQIDKKSLLNFKPLRKKGVFFVEIRVSKNFIAKLQVTINSLQEK